MNRNYSLHNPWVYPENLTPDEQALLEEFEEQLRNFESSGRYIKWPYLDTGGIRTTCDGENVNIKSYFISHPWTVGENGPLATTAQKSAEYDNLGQLPYGQNVSANSYKNKTNLRLSEQYCNQLFQNGLRDRYEELNNAMPNYNKMPLHARLPILEGHYNTGSYTVENEWPNLYKGARALNQEQICNNIRREAYDKRGNPISNMSERNTWGYEFCTRYPF